jgi:A/G-specific adenine glycosylase
MSVTALPPEARVAVLAWYHGRGRALPFRASRDPYAILVSEVMAQQTQASRAAEAWPAFMAAFPTPASLAAASPASVLRAWRGLGYNRRALALRDAAVRIVKQHAGKVPSDVDALQALPGIGPYTARAVAALAFGRPVGPVDTNVRRVLGRVFFDAQPGARELQAFADGVVPTDAAGTWTHAVMDIGARLCLPREPRCGACPLAGHCRFALSGRAATVPRTPARGRRASSSFKTTARWLRGRIVDRLRDAPDGVWVRFEGPIGDHEREQVAVELDRLARDGLLERHPDGGAAARLVT